MPSRCWAAHRTARPWALAAAASCLALAVSACGSGPSTSAAGAADLQGKQCCVVAADATATVVNGMSSTHNGWDIAFINFLTPHDGLGSQLCALVASRSRNPQVKDLAVAIDAAQGPRYQDMVAMAGAWGEPVPSTDPEVKGSFHDHGGSDADGATGKPATLVPLSGASFDREFLTIMINHHEAGLKVAQTTFDSGSNPQDKQLTHDLLLTQGAEVLQMRQLLAAL